MTASAIMIQGTCSNAGKSLLVAGLCRAFANQGLRVAPFKPQNMSNNAAATAEGEIGRAQALQARAAKVPASVHMNPVLLKPEGERGSQVVVQGRAFARTSAKDYYALKGQLLPRVMESFRLLKAKHDLVVVEGAGSPAEVNLRSGDIANMGFALHAGVPVVLVGDIERGGVIAQIVGTWELLTLAERGLIRGYAVNKFRGDVSLFDSALPILTQRTKLPCLGVVPWFEAASDLPPEDVLGLKSAAARSGAIKVAVPKLPRISNFDDLDPLALEPDVEVRVLEPGEALPGDTDLVLLPGSKATRSDTEFLRREGWALDILAHVRRGGAVLGLCGGYQMLGTIVRDPYGVEGEPGETAGLGLLDVATTLTGEKTVREVEGTDARNGLPVRGYEIHAGLTKGFDLRRPFLRLPNGPDGAVSDDGRVMGCYVHGLLASDPFRARFLAGLRANREPSSLFYERRVEEALDGLAAHLEAHLDLGRLRRLSA